MGIKITLEPDDAGAEEECLPCPNCGEETEADDKYCDDCGTKLPVAKPSTAQFSSARMDAMKKVLAGSED